MNLLAVIDHKSLGVNDLSTHYAGENEPLPGHCHDGPVHGLAMRVLSSNVHAMRCHAISRNTKVNGSSVSG